MVDLAGHDHLTWKRNVRLQKRLELQLQIMQEEYRMARRDLDKNSLELSECLFYLKFTAPGLSTYDQPDTRAMSAKDCTLKRRPNRKDNASSEDSGGPDEIFHSQTDRTEDGRGNNDGGGGGGESADPGEKKADEMCSVTRCYRIKPSSAPPSRKAMFKHREVLDSMFFSFLPYEMEKKTQGQTEQDEHKRFVGAVSSVSLNVKDVTGEMYARPSVASLCSSQRSRPRIQKSGSNAHSGEDSLREYILHRFNKIFDSVDKSPLNSSTFKASPPARPKNTDVVFSPQKNSFTPRSEQENQPSIPSILAVVNRQVACSAPLKRCEDPINVVAQTNSAQFQRDVKPNLQANGSVHAVLPVVKSVIASTAIKQEHGGLARGYLQHPAKRHKRPKTAPLNYELLRRNISAPRQQVAGIMAEIQSRRADTRLMLTKSLELKEMVNMLATRR